MAEVDKPLLDAVHYYLIAIGGLVTAIVFMYFNNQKKEAKKDEVILKITQQYAEDTRALAVESIKVISSVQTSVDNNTRVMEMFLNKERDEGSTRRR